MRTGGEFLCEHVFLALSVSVWELSKTKARYFVGPCIFILGKTTP